MSDKEAFSKNNERNNKKSNKNKKGKKKKKSLGFKIGVTLLILLVLSVTIISTIFFNTVNKLNRVELDNANLGIAEPEELEEYDNYDKITNIALFGIDAEGTGDVGRSDSIMIVTIDPIHDKLKITSLMRDTYVNIDGYGYDKLNHAYAYGGPELAIKTINKNFGLNIKNFATVNFSTLPQIIDLVGGIEINITEEELPYLNAVIESSHTSYGMPLDFIDYSGIQTLNGAQALAYTRNRSTCGGDFERTQRQRTVIEALFKKGLATPVSSYPSILSNVLPLITTNMSSSNILSFAKNVIGLGNGILEQERFPRDEYSQGGIAEDGVWYLMYDEEPTRQQIRDYIFDDKHPDDNLQSP